MIECMGEVAFHHEAPGSDGAQGCVYIWYFSELQNALRSGDCSTMTQRETIQAEGCGGWSSSTRKRWHIIGVVRLLVIKGRHEA